MVSQRIVMERNVHAYDEDVNGSLQSGEFDERKELSDKKALPLVEKLKEVVKNLTINATALQSRIGS